MTTGVLNASSKYICTTMNLFKFLLLSVVSMIVVVSSSGVDKISLRRIRSEIRTMMTNVGPLRESGLSLSDFIAADPSAIPYDIYVMDDDILNIHFTLAGPLDSPYAGGEYHGVIALPKNYPYAPPNIQFHTPNGRYEVGVNICLNASAHHKETWSQAFTMDIILRSLRTLFSENEPGIGSILNTSAQKVQDLARLSRSFSCSKCGFRAADAAQAVDTHPPAASEAPGINPKVGAAAHGNTAAEATVGSDNGAGPGNAPDLGITA